MEPSPSLFPTTHWTLVHLLHSDDDRGVEFALERLCTAYRSALYHYARASCLGPHDAEDAVQDFFVHVLGQEALKTLQKEKGKLRSWMVRSFNNRLVNRREHQEARKRGGGVEHVQWDFSSAEQEFSRHYHAGMDAAESCDLALALGIWEATLRRLDTDSKVQKRPGIYQALRPHLLQGWPKNGPNQTEVAARHGLTANALRVRFVNLIAKARRFFISITRETIDPLISEDDLEHLWNLLK